ncbi:MULTISPECIES: competence protein CoiA [Nostoc]|uniref:Competence protein CoiA-like family protein n=1 Tax=Nostoc paludosum FACHB-159 TaxID=2692908 RepID=A0ABR8KHH5_9NOSO|nr:MULTISPECIES: competence protein CoiA family protein [Nostoc]MBD2682192.1 hypothetical protein [Nostoc sp. FACHB-857]MBD2738520.1 hypothetical protein [Nostoc paludosum FACHB-159]
MKYALVNGIRQEATPKTKGICICCGSLTISKCGNQKVWHWAHDSKKICDSWWENETEWHRLWKSYFPENNQEVIQVDALTGEKHIADVKTDNGVVLEFQNSQISEQELSSREDFYKEMIWIVNGEKFLKNFTISSRVPNPSSELVQDILILQANKTHYAHNDIDAFWFLKKSENPDYINYIKTGKPYSKMGEIYYSLETINQEVNENYIGHHLFHWKNPRTIWYQSKKSVFIDFGGTLLWLLQKYDESGLMCIKKINKADFIRENGGVYTNIND